MCRLAFTTGDCCCCFSRPAGGKIIGLFYAILFFFCLIDPIIRRDNIRALLQHG